MKTYIQIGTNVGNDTFQRTVERIEEKINIVLVEPNVNLLEDIKKNYNALEKKHKINVISYGISTTEGDAELYFYWKVSGLSTLLKRRTIADNPEFIVKIKTITFDKLCEIIGTTEIEYLSIDAEGMDYLILNSIDLTKINIKEIIFEEWPHSNDDKNEKFSTGPEILEIVKRKYKDYGWEKITVDGMPSYRLTK